MDTIRAASAQLAGIEPYDPKYLPAQALLSANENPSDVDTEVRRDIEHAIHKLSFNRYPDPLANELRDLIAEANGLDRTQVLVGNGGDELLFNIALAWGGPARTFLNMPPTFSVYENNARLTQTNIVNVCRLTNYDIDEASVYERVQKGDIDYIIVTSPNNPTGKLAREEFMAHLLEITDALVVVDEAYFEFSRFSMRPYLAQHKNLLILRTFSKAFSLAGVRVGYVLGDASVIRELIKVRQPYSVDAISQTVARIVYENRAKFEPSIKAVIAERETLIEKLTNIAHVSVYPSDANYILFRLESADVASKVWNALYERGVLVRDFSHAPLLEGSLRVSVGSHDENELFLDSLREIVEK